jgi:hypothetical protein
LAERLAASHVTAALSAGWPIVHVTPAVDGIIRMRRVMGSTRVGGVAVGYLLHVRWHTSVPRHSTAADGCRTFLHALYITDLLVFSFSFQAHEYASALLRNVSNEKCCGLSLISASLSCCGDTTAYNPDTQTCADVSSMLSGELFLQCVYSTCEVMFN